MKTIKELIEAKDWVALQNMDLSCADFRETDLSGAMINNADFSWSDFRGINLSGVILSNSDLSNSDFRYAILRDANFIGTDLRGANLHGTDLSGVNLSGANINDVNLHNTVGNGKEIKSMQIETYRITWTKDVLQIGCKQYTIKEWKNFTDDEISEIDAGALDWWEKYKTFIFTAIKLGVV